MAEALDGTYVVEAEGRCETIAPGEFFLLSANTPIHIEHHAPSGSRPMRAQWLHLEFMIYETLPVSSLLWPPLRLTGPCTVQLADLIREFRAGPSSETTPLWWAARRWELASQALRLLTQVSDLRPQTADILSTSPRLLPVLRFIRTHLARSIAVSDLAHAAGLSPSRLHAAFRECLSRSPMAYVKQVRLSEARRRLSATDESMGEIAAATGFANQFHFSREFRRAFGMTPTQYRATHRTGPV
jgi:AraC-like DNA-binding protein